jgi:hypothetical protein
MAGNDDQTPAVSKVSLRGLVSRLTALALAVNPAAAGAVAAEETELRALEEGEIDREALDVETASEALGRGLAIALAELRPLAATQLASTWSLSSDPLRRTAVAIALEWAFPLVGDGLVIDHLSRDPDPAIRSAAARAAWVRRGTGGDLGVLARLADDPDPIVRTVALAAGA